MPKKIDPALRKRAVRLVREHRSEYPSLTAASAAVARQVGVSRQALHQGNPAAVEFIAWLRNDWTPPPEQQSDSQKLSDKVAVLEAKVKAERKKRIQAEQALTMSRHHLQLAVENLEAEIANKPKTGSLARARASRRPMTN